MSEQNDWLFRMIDNFVGEIRLVVEDQRDIVFTRDIFGSNDRKFVPRNVEVRTACGAGSPRGHPERGAGCGRLIERNILDAPTRNRATYSYAMQHPRKSDVINIKRLAGNFLPAFFAKDWFTNKVILFSRIHFVIGYMRIRVSRRSL